MEYEMERRCERFILRCDWQDVQVTEMDMEREIMSGHNQSPSSPRRPTNQLLDARDLIAAGITVALIGAIAVVGALVWLDASILLLGLSTIAIGLAFVIQGWLRVRRLARVLPEIPSSCESPTIIRSAPLKRWRRTLLAWAFVTAGILFLSAGVFLMKEAEPSGIGILLLGGVFTAFGLRGLLITARE